jgi:hypothetical protein
MNPIEQAKLTFDRLVLELREMEPGIRALSPSSDNEPQTPLRDHQNNLIDFATQATSDNSPARLSRDQLLELAQKFNGVAMLAASYDLDTSRQSPHYYVGVLQTLSKWMAAVALATVNENLRGMLTNKTFRQYVEVLFQEDHGDYLTVEDFQNLDGFPDASTIIRQLKCLQQAGIVEIINVDEENRNYFALTDRGRFAFEHFRNYVHPA